MSYFTWLAEGSKYHRACKRGDSISIFPTDDSVETLRQFQNIVDRAESDPDTDGLKVLKQIRASLSLPGEARHVCDAAVVYFG